MTARCRLCAGRSGAHFGWCSVVGGPGHRPVVAEVPAPAPSDTAHLGHFAAPLSQYAVNLPPGPDDRPLVLEVTSAVLCPECLGDWCQACDWSGMARPVEPQAQPEPVPALLTGLAAAVEQWAADRLDPRRNAA